MDPYATHIPLIALALHKTQALYPDLPIMECGCGDYSSPMFSLLSQGRKYVIYSADPKWSSQFTDLAEVRDVELRAENHWRDVEFEAGWGLCFMDSEEFVVHRINHIPDLLDKCKVVVMHDARHGCIPEAKYSKLFTRYKPWTWMGSNVEDVSKW
jgi:hypothetical protein